MRWTALRKRGSCTQVESVDESTHSRLHGSAVATGTGAAILAAAQHAAPTIPGVDFKWDATAYAQFLSLSLSLSPRWDIS
jgi:hypothetical protein